MSYPSADQPGVSSKHVTCSASRLFYRARRYRTAPPRVSRSRSRDRRGGLANPVRVVTERSSSCQRARRTTLTQVRVVALFDQQWGRVSDERAGSFLFCGPRQPARKALGLKGGEKGPGGVLQGAAPGDAPAAKSTMAEKKQNKKTAFVFRC